MVIRWLPAACLFLAACSGVPEVAPPSPTKPVILGTRGPLTDRQIKALFAKMGPTAEDLLQRHLAVEQAVAETPLIAGNRTRVLRDGPATFAAMFDAIRSARRYVLLEYFIFENVSSGDSSLADLLVEKRHQGVEIDIIYDSYGSADTPKELFDGLAREGIRIVQFNPLNPLDAKAGNYAPNDRDHRKILVVDGTQAIVGGVNLSVTYTSGRLPPSSRPEQPPALPWRDTDLRIEGPAVAQLQQLFLQHWREQHGPDLDISTAPPSPPAKGNEVIRIIGSTPDHDVPRFYVTLLSAIRTAERRIWLNTAYFVPTHQEMEDLIAAAKRGVDVRLVVPDASDSALAIAVQHSRYEDLLEAGVQIFETHDEVLHSKSAVIDGVWSVIGSSNFDHRSVLFNDEVDAVILGGDTADELQRLFEQDIAGARKIDLAAWRDRPLFQRMHELFARITQPML